MSQFVDSNTLTPDKAFDRTAISSDTDNDGEVLDTQGVRDINLITLVEAYSTGDLTIQIRTADDAGMTTNVEVIAADKINGNLYNSLLTSSELAADQIYHHHIQRTSHRRFIQVRYVSANTAGYTLQGSYALGRLSKSVANEKNPIDVS